MFERYNEKACRSVLFALYEASGIVQSAPSDAPFFGVTASDISSRIKPEFPRRENVTAGTEAPTDYIARLNMR